MWGDRSFYALAVAVCLLVVPEVALAQTNRGTIAGSVADSNGAAVPDATVKLEQKTTGLTQTVTTSTSGDFNFPDLAAGQYTITVSHTGFQTQQFPDLEVDVAKTTSLVVTLKVAQQTQVVEVTGTAPLLETNESAQNAVVATRAVQEIPLNARDYRQLLSLTPGFNSAFSQNGNRSNQNNWQLDGVDNNDFWHNSEAINQGSISGVAGVLLPIDAIAEFNQQSVGGADYGRNPGSMVNVVIKSGTNEIHGSAYYFHRNDAVAAAQPFNTPGTPSELRNHNFGASLGGPILKDKAFLFLSYEGQRLIAGQSSAATVPSDAWVAQAETVLAKYNVPVNPVMTNVLANLWPSSIKSAPGTSLNFVSGDNNAYRSNNFVGRIDYNISEKNRFFIRSIIGTGDATAFAGSVYKEYFQAVPSRQQNWAAVWTSTFTPRIVNQVLFGVNYFLQEFDDLNHGASPPALGFNTGVTSFNFGTPNMELSGFGGGGVGETPNLGRTDTTWHVTDDLSYAMGSHQLKFGGEFRHAKLFVHYLREARGGFSWDGTAGPWAGDPAFGTPQKALADFLAGFIAPGNGAIATGDPRRNWFVNSISGYGQDNWQYTPKLNFTLGLRYDYNGPFYDPTHTISTFLPTFTPTGLAFPGQNGSPISSLYPKDRNNFAPRLGFAYSPVRGGRTVIRGAWGVYYDIPNGNLFIDNRAAGDASRGTSRNPACPNCTPVFTISNDSLITVQQGVFLFGSTTFPPPPPYGIYGIDQGLRSPYVQNFSLNLQQQLTPRTLLQIGYVGSQGRKLLVNRNQNQPPPSPTAYANFQAARPYDSAFPQFSGITELMSGSNSHYNSMQVTLRNTSWRGLQGQISYTLGHAMDYMSNVRNNHPTDSNNLKLDWGNADFDTRHDVSGYLIYDAPQLGHSLPRLTKGWEFSSFFQYNSGYPFTVGSGLGGRTSGSHTGSGKDRANETGNPFSAITQPTQQFPGTLSSGVAWFNPGAFTDNEAATFGTTRRNQFYGPKFKSVDFSVIKNTPITERLSAQFRVEIFNIFNILNLAGPNACIATPAFGPGGSGCGLITSTYGTAIGAPGIGPGEPTNVQFALKLIW